MRFKPELVLFTGLLLLFPASSARDIQFMEGPRTANGQLTIIHSPLQNAPVGKQITLNATVTSLNPVSSVKIFYIGTNSTTFNWTDMTLVSGDIYNGTWNGTIPGQRECGKLFYYLMANDTKGNYVTEPKNISAPFEVSIVDMQPPMIYHLSLWHSYEGSPIPIWAIIADDVGVRNVTLYYRKHNETRCHPLQMNISKGDRLYANWTAAIPKQSGGVLWYWVNATDGANNATTGNISVLVEPVQSQYPDKDRMTILAISICVVLIIVLVILYLQARKRRMSVGKRKRVKKNKTRKPT